MDPRSSKVRRAGWILLPLVGTVLAGGVWWYKRERLVIPNVPSEGIEPAVLAEIEKARSAIFDNPSSPAAWGQVGLVLFANDLYPEAIPWLERAERMDPHDARWPYFLGMALLLERPDDGLSALQRAATLAPQDPFVQLRWAEALLAADRVDEADAAFTIVLQRQPDNARAWLGRGQILLRRGEVTAAIALLEKATGHPTARKAALASLAEAHQRLGQADRADSFRQQAAESPSDVPWADPKIVQISVHQVSRRGRWQQAMAMIQADQIDAGIAHLRRLLRDHPDYTEARIALARAWIRVQDFERAEEEIQRALEQDGTNPDAYMLAGGLAVQRGDVAQGEAHYRKSLELRPADAVAWYNVADCRLRQSDTPGAIEALQQALRFRPGFLPAHLKITEVYLITQQTDKARRHLDAASKIDPNHPQIATLRARLPH
jgi:tetratricopeptide (TPR) repeat protein